MLDRIMLEPGYLDLVVEGRSNQTLLFFSRGEGVAVPLFLYSVGVSSHANAVVRSPL